MMVLFATTWKDASLAFAPANLLVRRLVFIPLWKEEEDIPGHYQRHLELHNDNMDKVKCWFLLCMCKGWYLLPFILWK